jgi:glycosyltransferase involved in cell wall biosynthesis
LVPKQRADTQEASTSRPLRVLYVGAMSQRKGISYLLRAMELVDGIAELSLIGRLGHPSSELAAALNRHTWTPTLPHGQVLEAMRNADVLVLPTLFEGRALVVLEALSQGVAVITTPNSGAEDVVLDGETGFIVPIRSAEAIAEKLTRLAEDRSLLGAMREKARKVAEDCTWERYRTQLVGVFAGVISRPVS